MDNQSKIIEINGVKFEVDLRTAKVISEYKVGDKIKVLTKEYSGYASSPGVIVGFDNFAVLPTVIIAYVKRDHSGTPLVFAYLNSETKELEICPAGDDVLLFDQADVERRMNKDIEEAKVKLDDLIAKKQYFLDRFSEVFKATRQ